MEAGNLRPGSDEAEVLLTSIRVAQSPVLPDLGDLKALSSGLVVGDIQWWKVVPRPCCCLHYAELNILYVCLDDWSSKECWIVVEAIFCFEYGDMLFTRFLCRISEVH